MLKKLLLIFAVVALPCSSVFAQISEGDCTVGGYFKNEISVELDNWDQVTKFKNIFGLSMEYDFNPEAAIFVSTKYWYDSVYGWYDRYDSDQYYMQHIQRNDWLRACYMDYTVGNWFLRLGKQQVAWGQADGVAILDRINPVDLTEFYLPDAEDMRIPLWMVNINYVPKLNSNIQLLIIPDFEQSTGAPPGSPFAFRAYNLFRSAKTGFEAAPGAPNKKDVGFPFGTNYYGVLNADIYYPEKKLENSKIAVQWQDRIADWDYTLNYIYGFDYLARTYKDSQGFIPGLPPTLIRNYGRRFKLVQTIGGSLNHTFTREGPFKGITLRSDAAVYLNEPTYYGDAATGESMGVNRWDNVLWLVGLDKTVYTNWQISFQFAQYIMEHSKPGVDDYQTLSSFTNGAQDAVENSFSFKIGTDFLNQRIKPEILWGFTDDNQGRISPKVTFEARDNLWITAGIHYFYGKAQDSNGQYRDASQFYTSVKYTF